MTRFVTRSFFALPLLVCAASPLLAQDPSPPLPEGSLPHHLREAVVRLRERLQDAEVRARRAEGELARHESALRQLRLLLEERLGRESPADPPGAQDAEGELGRLRRAVLELVGAAGEGHSASKGPKSRRKKSRRKKSRRKKSRRKKSRSKKSRSKKSKGLLERRLALNMDDVSLVDVATFLEDMSGVALEFAPSIDPEEESLELQFADAPLREVFDRIAAALGPDVGWRFDARKKTVRFARRGE